MPVVATAWIPPQLEPSASGNCHESRGSSLNLAWRRDARSRVPAFVLLSLLLQQWLSPMVYRSGDGDDGIFIAPSSTPLSRAFALRGAGELYSGHFALEDEENAKDEKRFNQAVNGEDLDIEGAAAKPLDPLIGQVADGLLNVALVELEVDDFPWRIAKVLVPLSPEVAKWWTELDTADFTARLDGSREGRPRLVVQIEGATPLEVGNVQVRGVRTTVLLPEDAILHACHVGSVRVTADVTPLAELGPIRALLVVCPVQGAGEGVPTHSAPFGGTMAETARNALSGQNPLRWLLLPWILLLMPFILGSTMGPAALLGGACLTLASFASLSFIVAIIIVTVHRRFAVCTRRWRRLWRLRILSRRPVKVDEAYGQNGPCCICLATSAPDEAMLVLLPCRHSLHIDCYSNWVKADSYPSHDLICPLCRSKAEAIGQVVGSS